MRRCRGDSGVSATQLAVVMPAIVFFIMLIVQYGLWAHAKQVASAAAAEGVDAGQVASAPASAAEDAARSFLAAAGNLDDIAVTVVPGAASLSVRVDGRAPQLVPGFAWRVTSVPRPRSSASSTKTSVPDDRRQAGAAPVAISVACR